MAYVMRVVINRTNSEYFPDTIKEVVEQPYQFESYSNGSYHKAIPSTECHLALATVERNIMTNSQVIAFEYIGNGDRLSKYFDYSFKYDGHNFYVRKNENYID